jgi:hypothetical protein
VGFQITQLLTRSERRLGEMMEEQPKAATGQHTGNQYVGIGVRETPIPTLASQGIDKNLAKRALG